MPEVQTIADLLRQSLPTAWKDLVASPEFKGADLIDVKSLSQPCKDDLERNFEWLDPFCKAYPDSIPSAFLIADVLLLSGPWLSIGERSPERELQFSLKA